MGFRPDIEGLRAIAILLVVAYHALIPGFSGGFIGVDIFFVLSGYLITGLLLREVEETGTLDLARFYARRARRLLPAAAAMLIVTMILSAVILAPYEQRSFTSAATSTAAYFSNLYYANAATVYLNGRSEGNPFLHTWSLSVEEQFYFFWPLFVMFGLSVLRWQNRANSSRRRLLRWMIGVAGISFAFSYYLTGVRQSWAFFSSPTRAWEFALGAIVILLSWEKSPAVPGSVGRPSAIIGNAREFLGWAGFAGLFVTTVAFGKTTLFPGIAVLLPALSTALILWSAAKSAKNPIVRMLSVRPLQEVGRLSYSLYLWHWPILVLGAALTGDPPLWERVGLVSLSVLPAMASYRFVENPIRHNRQLASRNRYSLAMAGLLAVFGIGLSLTWRVASDWTSEWPSQVRYTHAQSDGPTRLNRTNGCLADYFAVVANPCVFGVEHSPLTVVLLGDSHAAQWFPALDFIARQRNWRLVTMTKAACAMVEKPYFYDSLGRYYTECMQWRKDAIEKIRQIHPALTVMTSSRNYLIREDEWSDGISITVKSVSEASQNVLILKDTPLPVVDVPTCLARRAWRPSFIPSQSCRFAFDDPQSRKIYDFQRATVLAHSNVTTADVSGDLCSNQTCSGEAGNILIFRDASHITASAAMLSEPVLAREIDRAMSRENAQHKISLLMPPPLAK
jgi:peptidoglycan/LPS O-acetylase OafA/YrhL